MFYRVPAAFWVPFHGVCTAISVRLRDAFGVCIAFPWRSGTALNSYKCISFNYYFICFVIFKIILFVIFVFLSYMLKQNATGRGRSST